MHILRVESRSIDGTAEAVDLGQSPADIVALSFTDADLSVLATAWEAHGDALPSLRLASLNRLRHPYSVDLYIEKVLSKARFVLIRLLGGKDYWSYGVDELEMLARLRGIHLAIVPGDHREDARLDAASTLPAALLRQIGMYFSAGGVENIGTCLRFVADLIPIDVASTAAVASPISSSNSPPILLIPPFGWFTPAMHPGTAAAPLALLIFYRAWMLAADTEPVVAQAQALASRGFRVAAAHVTSLKDAAVVARLGAWLALERPDIILNMTAFSARLDVGGSVLDQADAPVFQLALSGGSEQQWADSQRGLGSADLVMNVVLPEFDGRIIASAISFKDEATRNAALEFTRVVHRTTPHGVSYAADLALAWATLRRTPRAERRVACVLSDYPAKAGRTGYAVGLDTPRSVIAIAERLACEGFSIEIPDSAATLIEALSVGEQCAVLGIAEYERQLDKLPNGFVAQVYATWGAPDKDAAIQDGSFCFRFVRAGKLLIAVQPDRGNVDTRKTEYHDARRPPRHGYIAFYLWLRMIEQVHAVIHCGTHGTLEWLPGKAVALSESCAPRAVLGALPLIYPFIVNNPGEAAQAKRRVAAVTIGHLTPPLTQAGAHGAAAELEGLFDEYAEAQSLDPRRAARLAELIMERARETGLATESGAAPDADPQAALLKLDAWLCDLKDMRIGDGLHVFGQVPDATRRAEAATSLAAISGSADAAAIDRLIRSCAEAEMRGLLAALDGRFVVPGPAGAPDRGRIDVLPTGRNLFSIDPRAVPTRTAWEIGRRTAEAMLIRHVQDNGQWPLRVVLDIWGSATMRTGGDDLAQAFVSALDVLTGETLRSDFIALWSGGQLQIRSVLLVTHNIEEAVFMCDRVLILSSNPGRIAAEIMVSLPRPRERLAPAFREVVDDLYSRMTAGPVPDSGGNRSTESAASLSTRLPIISGMRIVAMTEMLAQALFGGRASLPALASHLHLSTEALLRLTEVTHMMGFAELRNGELHLTASGRALAEADGTGQKVLFAEHLLRSVPLAAHILRVLQERPRHVAPRDRFRAELEDHLSTEDAERTLSAVIGWGRFAEIFAYDHPRRSFSLDNPQ